MSVLLHTCCAPCLVGCREVLINEGIKSTLFWYNPNIHPWTEYKTRKDCLIDYANSENLSLIINDSYGLRSFIRGIYPDFSKERCKYCYKIRLEETAKYAALNGYEYFSTTLLISPYQNHELIKEICLEFEKIYAVKFLYRDFRPYFKRGQMLARELGLYMQKYCGCIFSEESRYTFPDLPKPNLPENFKFLPALRNIVIKKERKNKEKYMDLLLKADPSEDMVNEYLKDGEMFVLTYKGEVVCVSVVSKIDENTCELKNLVTKKEYRSRGYAGKMIKYLFDNCKQKYKKMIVGTAEPAIAFYVKHGFERYEKTIKNFFIDNYKEEIIDGDFKCADIHYYSKDLSK